MNKPTATSWHFELLKSALQLNFNTSIIGLFVMSGVTITGSPLFFENNTELYGPMASNLPLMLIYLCLTEIAIIGFCRFSNNYQAILFMGGFLLLLTVSLEFYSAINALPIDDNYRRLFLYLGLSHLAYGGIQTLKIMDDF